MEDWPSNLTGLANFLERKWFEKSGLFAAMALCAVGSVVLFTSQDDAPWARALLGIAVALIVLCAWLYSRQVPKTKPGRVGIAVAIACENDEESRRLHADFVTPLQKAIHDGASGSSLQFIELPSFLTSEIVDKVSALKMREKCGTHLLLYGRVRRRLDGGNEFCFMELEGVVAHKPISKEASLTLGKEFSEIIPRRVKIPAGREFADFSFTSAWAEIVSKYVLGISAGLSGELTYAEALFLEVRQKLKASMDGKFPIYTKLIQRIPSRLAEVYEAKAVSAYSIWRESGSSESIDELGQLIKKMGGAGVERLDSYYFLSAIHHFLSRRDVGGALVTLKNVKNSGGVWNLNVAFLNGYKGNLKSATRNYKSPACKSVELDVVLQVEDFLCRILELEPEKYQLHFCLGVFNLHVKGDPLRAARDFEDFLSKGVPSEFADERVLAKNWIGEIINNPQNVAFVKG